jgi:hypothetical protein
VEQLETRALLSGNLPLDPGLQPDNPAPFTDTYQLVALSGKSAVLQVGGEQPVRQSDGSV